MACFRPIDCWPASKTNENGRRPVVFNPHEGLQDSPLQVPCGSCDGCRADQAREWAIRMMHEAQCWAENCFITLTYADRVEKADHCLIAPKTLVKKDLQDFFKRLRKKYKFRYFACGEYGTDTRRPHYHAVIFGQDFLSASIPMQDNLYNNLDLERTWGHGHVVCAPADPATFSYVAGYCAKKIGDPDTFNIASTVPPLGYEWYIKNHRDLINTGHVIFNEREYPIPKAYFRFDNSNKVCLLGGDLQKVKDDRKLKMQQRGVPEYRHLDNKQLNVKSRLTLKKEML